MDHALLDAVGDSGGVTLFFHPRQWSVLLEVATSIAGDFMPAQLRAILSATGPWEAARIAAAAEGKELPPNLAGWDEERPVLVSLFEAPELSVDRLLALTGDLEPSQLFSHTAVIPATDPNALLLSLLSVARMADCTPLPVGVAGAFPGPAGAAGALRCGDLAVVFDSGDGFVRMRAAEGDDHALTTGPLARPRPQGVTTTPALRWAMAGSVVVAGHVRPSQMRRAGLMRAAGEAAHALHYATMADRQQILGAARSELLGAMLRTSSVGVEVDDLAVGLVPGIRPTFTFVQGLTTAGVTAYDRGTETPEPGEGPPDAPFVVQTQVNVDVMQAAAGVPFGMAGVRDLDEARSRIQECGPICYLHLLTSRIFGLGALADQVGLRAGLEEEVGPLFRFVPAELPPGITMTMALDIPTLVERLDEDVVTRRVAESIGVIHVIQARQGRTVMTNVRLGDRPPTPEPLALTQNDPGSLDAPLARTESAACVERSALLIEQVLKALHMEALSNRDELLVQSQQALDAVGACADESPELSEIYGAYIQAFTAAIEASGRRGQTLGN